MKAIIGVLMVLAVCLSGNAASKNESLIVVGDNVNVRKSPSVSSGVLLKINNTKTVIVLNREGKKETVGGNVGEWVFVDTGSLTLNNMKDTINRLLKKPVSFPFYPIHKPLSSCQFSI